MNQMEFNPYYAWPPYILIIEWVNLKKDATEKSTRLGGEIVPPEERRYVIILRMKLCINYS